MEFEVDEAGANLSGGEKQRIAFARSMYQDVDVFIISHAPETEKYVNKMLEL